MKNKHTSLPLSPLSINPLSAAGGVQEPFYEWRRRGFEDECMGFERGLPAPRRVCRSDALFCSADSTCYDSTP